jgi:transcriptional regulator with XRE-family HTH domain
MLAIRITGSQLRAARAIVGLSMGDLAERARLSSRVISKWESSSNAVPEANVAHFNRALDVLESEGVRFIHGGVHLARPTSTTTVTASEGIPA